MAEKSAAFYKKTYPALWRQVYDKVLDDAVWLAQTHKLVRLPVEQARILAHNAAFTACDAHHYGAEGRPEVISVPCLCTRGESYAAPNSRNWREACKLWKQEQLPIAAEQRHSYYNHLDRMVWAVIGQPLRPPDTKPGNVLTFLKLPGQAPVPALALAANDWPF